MNTDFLHDPRHSSQIRSFNGCWTCRLRRKKCDEKRPICDGCAALHITCHYAQNKPEWMDGGAKQEKMAEQIKRKVKENAHRRRGDRAVHYSGDRSSVAEAKISESALLPQELPTHIAPPLCDSISSIPNSHNHASELYPEASAVRSQGGSYCTFSGKDSHGSTSFGRSDSILLLFYLEHVFPFLFPFYRTTLCEGGRAWILEMMIGSPVVRQATLCQSSYFFSLARGTNDDDGIWEGVLQQTRDAFGILGQALQVINGSDITEHLHGAVRILASIMQVQRFEITVLSFDNCQAHLNAALALFEQLVGSTDVIDPVSQDPSFNAILGRLGPSSFILPAESVQVPSAEQAAFRFSSSLLILDDIIASTVLQEQPRLYRYHRSLLGSVKGNDPAINLDAVTGCQNWALLHIGEIAALDAWKQQCKAAGILDVMGLVHRATAIKDSLETHLTQIESNPVSISKTNSLLAVFSAVFNQPSEPHAIQSSLITRVWAHAALVYLSVVVSGWQPASAEIRYHVGQILQLLTRQISPPALLRTMAWPFCVAGCLAEPEEEPHFRGVVEALQPPSIFGTVRKALEIMENVWQNRHATDSAHRDLAMCFRSQGSLVLLV